MNTAEPNATALLLTTCGLLLAVSVVFSRASQRAGVPIALLFLLIGIVAGSEGLGGIAFEDYRFAFRLGAIALALILFDGGLSTPVGAVRKVWAPAAATRPETSTTPSVASRPAGSSASTGARRS